jgi:cytochrome c oxidase assembly protein subunit 11
MKTVPLPGVQTKRMRRTALACAGVALAMVGVAFASVPLYDLFCRITGYDGTPATGTAGASRVLDRTITVRFDANVASGLPWRFTPETPSIEAKLGETRTVFYKVRNDAPTATTGIATFNVQPGQAGGFFVKLECFCFKEQTLQPGETMDFPVVFYIEPGLAENDSVEGLSSLTLSYTYFPARHGQPLATSSAAAAQRNPDAVR